MGKRIALAVTTSTVMCAGAYADTGDIRLIDGSRLEYMINQDISSASTSSASGAASEASFTTAIAASTAMGGSVNATLSDMFDGSMSLGVSLTSATTPLDTSDPEWSIYYDNGFAAPNVMCVGAGGALPTPSTLTGTSFVSTGFVGGEQITISVGSNDTVVSFLAGDQSPAAVVAAINAAHGTPLASVVSGAIVLSHPRIASLSVVGTGAMAIGLAAGTYVEGTLGDVREVTFAAQTMGALEVSRRVYVPEDDTFMRTMSTFHNTGASSITFTVQLAGNLGSDGDTIIWGSSNGDTVADVTDNWIGSFENFDTPNLGGNSSDPRVAFVLGNAGSPVQLAELSYVDGDDDTYWIYSVTLAPGETKSILNFAVGAGTKTAAQMVAEDLVDPRNRPAALRCISAADAATVVNLPAGACALAADTTCDDGNAGTTGDVCTAIGTCAGTPVVEPDGGVDGGMDAPKGDGCGCTVVGAERDDAPLSIAGLLSVLALVVGRRRAASRRRL